FGHVTYSGLKQLHREGLVEGMSMDEASSTPDCEACIQAKQTCAPFPQSTSKEESRVPGEITHSDVWGTA
ncbi:hypothetical protein M405DRAFT_713120, partial [Rhizopogon salebrosus TDB-379]